MRTSPWKFVDDSGSDLIGLLPTIFLDSDPRPAAEQANDRYIGGWSPQDGWKLNVKTGAASYPGDPVQMPGAVKQLNNELLLVYKYGYVAVLQRDGSYEMARMD